LILPLRSNRTLVQSHPKHSYIDL